MMEDWEEHCGVQESLDRGSIHGGERGERWGDIHQTIELQVCAFQLLRPGNWKTNGRIAKVTEGHAPLNSLNHLHPTAEVTA